MPHRKSTVRTTHHHHPSRKDTTMKNRTAHIIGLSVLGLSAVITAGSTAMYISASTSVALEPKPTTTPAWVASDAPVYGSGVPQCTDAIADAGGICWGEPIAEPVTEAAPVVVAQPAPAVVIQQAAPQADLPPCATEDSDNCYWDAATMGNGQGRSFVTLHGTTYYADGPTTPTDGTHAGVVTLNGEAWNYVDGWDTLLYCTAPLKVGIDVDDNGNEWAACM